MKKDTPEYVKELARGLRREQTNTESLLWKRLRAKRFAGYKFRRQYSIGRYILDYYCHSAKLAIEIDGKIHEHDESIEYDNIRGNELNSRGIRTIRFTNEQVINDTEGVLDCIHKVINCKQSSHFTPSPTIGRGKL